MSDFYFVLPVTFPELLSKHGISERNVTFRRAYFYQYVHRDGRM